MREDASGRRQRAVMATDAEWERIGRAAAASGMDLSLFVIHRALDRDSLQGGAVHAGYLSIFNILPYRSDQPSGALL